MRNGLDRLRQTTDIFGPTVGFVAPAQTVCNYATLLFRNAASLFSQGSPGGRWQRFTVFDPPDGPNNEGQVASAPANGGGSDNRNFLHYNPYPNTAAPGQTRECEAGNENRGGFRPATAADRQPPRQPGHESPTLQLPSQSPTYAARDDEEETP